MELKHVTAYVSPQTFRDMEEVRALPTMRMTRSQWIELAIKEKVARESMLSPAMKTPISTAPLAFAILGLIAACIGVVQLIRWLFF